MSWSIDLSKSTLKFLKKQPVLEGILMKELSKFAQKLSGEIVNIDLKKLSGKWAGCSRIRKGDIRIIVTADMDEEVIYVESIDFRGDVYK
jgi:mRNA-degrading endonuclease RelE of RelBE toxin-antitoxin system